MWAKHEPSLAASWSRAFASLCNRVAERTETWTDAVDVKRWTLVLSELLQHHHQSDVEASLSIMRAMNAMKKRRYCPVPEAYNVVIDILDMYEKTNPSMIEAAIVIYDADAEGDYGSYDEDEFGVSPGEMNACARWIKNLRRHWQEPCVIVAIHESVASHMEDIPCTIQMAFKQSPGCFEILVQLLHTYQENERVLECVCTLMHDIVWTGSGLMTRDELESVLVNNVIRAVWDSVKRFPHNSTVVKTGCRILCEFVMSDVDGGVELEDRLMKAFCNAGVCEDMVAIISLHGHHAVAAQLCAKLAKRSVNLPDGS
jgi:hypothetical protein